MIHRRDPRYADLERFIGLLTAAIGFGSFVPWPSKLLSELQDHGLATLWTAMFLIVGLGLAVASYVHDLRLRWAFLALAALIWAVFVWLAWKLRMPVLLISAVIMVWQCARVARILRGGDDG